MNLTQIVEHHVDVVKIQGAYKVIVDAINKADLNRAEATVAMLAIIAVQFNGHALPPHEMAEYVNDASQWLTAYFVEPDNAKKN